MRTRKIFKKPHMGEFKLPHKPDTKVSYKGEDTEIESISPTSAGVWWYYLKNGAGPLAEEEFKLL